MKRIHWALVGILVVGLIVFLAFQDPSTRWPQAVIDLNDTLDRAGQAINNEQWDDAQRQLNRAMEQWTSVEKILFLNTEPTQMTNFSRHLSRLQAAVEVKDPINSRLELVDLHDIWTTLISW